MRIISTVPSQTELLSYLGLDEYIVGITKFCVHPAHIYRSKSRIGGTKDLNLDMIRGLDPDLIIANKEENDRAQIEALQSDYNVLVTDVKDLESALAAIRTIGDQTNTAAKAEVLAQKIDKRFNSLTPAPPQSVLYLIWQDPYMSVGHDTFIHDMLKRCGLENVCAQKSRYPEVNVGNHDPDLILLSSEPYPFKVKHLAEIQAAWPRAEIRLVDGEYFSWYGSRMLSAGDYFEEVISSLTPHR